VNVSTARYESESDVTHGASAQSGADARRASDSAVAVTALRNVDANKLKATLATLASDVLGKGASGAAKAGQDDIPITPSQQPSAIDISPSRRQLTSAPQRLQPESPKVATQVQKIGYPYRKPLIHNLHKILLADKVTKETFSTPMHTLGRTRSNALEKRINEGLSTLRSIVDTTELLGSKLEDSRDLFPDDEDIGETWDENEDQEDEAEERLREFETRQREIDEAMDLLRDEGFSSFSKARRTVNARRAPAVFSSKVGIGGSEKDEEPEVPRFDDDGCPRHIHVSGAMNSIANGVYSKIPDYDGLGMPVWMKWGTVYCIRWLDSEDVRSSAYVNLPPGCSDGVKQAPPSVTMPALIIRQSPRSVAQLSEDDSSRSPSKRELARSSTSWVTGRGSRRTSAEDASRRTFKRASTEFARVDSKMARQSSKSISSEILKRASIRPDHSGLETTDSDQSRMPSRETILKRSGSKRLTVKHASMSTMAVNNSEVVISTQHDATEESKPWHLRSQGAFPKEVSDVNTPVRTRFLQQDISDASSNEKNSPESSQSPRRTSSWRFKRSSTESLDVLRARGIKRSLVKRNSTENLDALRASGRKTDGTIPRSGASHDCPQISPRSTGGAAGYTSETSGASYDILAGDSNEGDIFPHRKRSSLGLGSSLKRISLKRAKNLNDGETSRRSSGNDPAVSMKNHWKNWSGWMLRSLDGEVSIARLSGKRELCEKGPSGEDMWETNSDGYDWLEDDTLRIELMFAPMPIIHLFHGFSDLGGTFRICDDIGGRRSYKREDGLLTISWSANDQRWGMDLAPQDSPGALLDGPDEGAERIAMQDQAMDVLDPRKIPTWQRWDNAQEAFKVDSLMKVLAGPAPDSHIYVTNSTVSHVNGVYSMCETLHNNRVRYKGDGIEPTFLQWHPQDVQWVFERQVDDNLQVLARSSQDKQIPTKASEWEEIESIFVGMEFHDMIWLLSDLKFHNVEPPPTDLFLDISSESAVADARGVYSRSPEDHQGRPSYTKAVGGWSLSWSRQDESWQLKPLVPKKTENCQLERRAILGIIEQQCARPIFSLSLRTCIRACLASIRCR
jgi:hypothetical protein